MTALTFTVLPCIEHRRWRWPWLFLQWEPLAAAEDYTFVEGGCLEGIEEWQA